MILNNDIYNDFCYSGYINCSLYWLIIDYFCQSIDNNKDGVVAVALSISKYKITQSQSLLINFFNDV